MNTQTDNNENSLLSEGKNLLEWTVFTVSLLIVVAVLTYLTFKTITYQPSPADITVALKAKPTSTMPHRYHVSISNIGGETAENVVIEFLLMVSDSTLEKAELEMPFVPQSSKREAWINFSTNPATADSIVTRVVSFKKPS